jgi:filamentous hemagglutinin family protein
MNKLNYNLVLGLLLGLSSGQAAYANPTGAEIINGQVTFVQPDANTLNITNSNGAVINWQQFSIQQNEITRFIQDSANSAVLNRIVGQDPSALLGQLLSNGRVFLINPNGILFGPNSVIDTAGLIASTLDMTDEDFINQNLTFKGDNAADIQNQGYIKAGENGDIFLIAPNIENSGIIETEGGEIILAAGESIMIASLDSDDIVFDVQAPENEAVNLGKMITNGGAARMFAGTIKQAGSINANSISVDENGNVQLFAQADIEITSDAMIAANGSMGGKIKIESDTGTVWNSGTIEAKGEEGQGGQVEVLGERVAVLDEASIDASGETGGGEILVGGDYQGKNDDVKNARQTYIGKDVSIKADAITSGDGGKVIVWADETTQFYGEISAKGGSESGDGGFVETSGKEYLEALGQVNASATNGNAGEWLLDPRDVVLQIVAPTPTTDNSSNGSFDSGTPNVFTPTADTAVADIDQIVVSLEGGTSVTITTTDVSGFQSGDITVIDPISVTLNSGNVLFTLDADNNIVINNNITASGANTLALGLDATGTITINGDINTNNGFIDALSMGAGNVLFSGTRIINSDLNALTLTIDGADDVSFNGITNTFSLIHSAGTLAGSGTMNVASTWNPTGGTTNINSLVLGPGSFNTVSSTVSGTTVITNQGNLTLSGGTINPNFINQGLLTEVGGGTLGGTATQSSGITFLSGGTLTITTLNINGGLLHGDGTIAGTVNNNGGLVTPGNILGTLNITGNYVQAAGGTFQADIGGLTTAGTDYDLLNVTGNVLLAGTLDIQLANGFTSTLGDQFDIINSASVSGDFTTVTSPFTVIKTPNTPLTGDYQIEIGATTVDATNDVIVTVNSQDELEKFFSEDLFILFSSNEEGDDKKIVLACQ